MIFLRFCQLVTFIKNNKNFSQTGLATIRAHYHKYVTQRAKANGIVPFYWDNGGTGDFACGIFK